MLTKALTKFLFSNESYLAHFYLSKCDEEGCHLLFRIDKYYDNNLYFYIFDSLNLISLHLCISKINLTKFLIK